MTGESRLRHARFHDDGNRAKRADSRAEQSRAETSGSDVETRVQLHGGSGVATRSLFVCEQDEMKAEWELVTDHASRTNRTRDAMLRRPQIRRDSARGALEDGSTRVTALSNQCVHCTYLITVHMVPSLGQRRGRTAAVAARWTAQCALCLSAAGRGMRGIVTVVCPTHWVSG